MWWIALALAKPIKVPVDVGVGPSAHLISGPVFADQPIHTGLSLSVQAIINKKLIRKYKKRIPSQYRAAALRMNEIRYAPFIWLPETLFISPGINGTGMYGATWRPISLGLTPMLKPVRFSLNAGLRLTYIFIHSTKLPSPTHFLRPGIDLRAEVEVPLSKKVLFSLSWTSQFYPPQEVGGEILKWGRLEDSIWHIGQANVMFHYRFPYKTKF